MTLSELTKHQSARISHLPSDFHLSAQLIEQGFALNSEIAIAHKAPFNGPIAVSLHGTKMSLPMNIAAQIEVEIVK